MRNITIIALLSILPLLACRGEEREEGRVSIHRATPSPSIQPEPPDSTDALGEAVSALLNRFQEANASYARAEITKDERTSLARELEQDAWRLMQGAKTLAEKAAKVETDPKRKAFEQELELFLLLYLGDLHAALCAERTALETGKSQWNKRARLHAQLLPSLANSIRSRSEGTISFPNLSPGPGKLPAPSAPSEKATTPTSKAAVPSTKAATPPDSPVISD